MGAKKKAAAPKSAKKTPERTTEALRAGQDAAGAKLVKEGFAFTPEMDLAFALGFPHMRFVTDDASDKDVEAAIKGSGSSWDARLVWPRATATAYVLTLAAENDDKWKKQKGPITAEMAYDIMVARTNFGSVPTRFHQPASIQLLEAMVGTEPVVNGMLDGLEKRLARHPVDFVDGSWSEVGVWELGYLLLRLPDEESAAAKKRIEALVKAFEDKKADDRRVVSAMRLSIGGRAAAEKYAYRPDGNDPAVKDAPISPFELGHVTDDAAFVADHVVRGGGPDVSSFPDARLSFLGGDAVLSTEKKHWSKYRGKGVHAYIVATFGEIRSPMVEAMIADMAKGSSAKREAAAWLAARG